MGSVIISVFDKKESNDKEKAKTFAFSAVRILYDGAKSIPLEGAIIITPQFLLGVVMYGQEKLSTSLLVS